MLTLSELSADLSFEVSVAILKESPQRVSEDTCNVFQGVISKLLLKFPRHDKFPRMPAASFRGIATRFQVMVVKAFGISTTKFRDGSSETVNFPEIVSQEVMWESYREYQEDIGEDLLRDRRPFLNRLCSAKVDLFMQIKNALFLCFHFL